MTPNTPTMATYHCDGFRNLRTGSASEAAKVFANRKARAEFGRRGYCRTMRLDCWTENLRSHTFEAFIGHDLGMSMCCGHNIWLTVSRIGE